MKGFLELPYKLYLSPDIKIWIVFWPPQIETVCIFGDFYLAIIPGSFR